MNENPSGEALYQLGTILQFILIIVIMGINTLIRGKQKRLISFVYAVAMWIITYAVGYFLCREVLVMFQFKGDEAYFMSYFVMFVLVTMLYFKIFYQDVLLKAGVTTQEQLIQKSKMENDQMEIENQRRLKKALSPWVSSLLLTVGLILVGVFVFLLLRHSW